ncbi:SRPBCC family protein [Niastella populi]|uniref:SRPBCC family protein n=1 Tax=Niastella populi TaxID=550983 RepID=UPI001A98471C|nr:SRPBCC family protein [Niastella populi]
MQTILGANGQIANVLARETQNPYNPGAYMKGIKFSKSIIINCSQAEAFDYTQDYANRLNWDTFLKKAALIEGATEACKGIKAYCVAKDGLGMVTEYVSFNRPKATAINLTKGPFLFKSWTFKESGDSKTEGHCFVFFQPAFSLQPRYSFYQKLPRSKCAATVDRS